MERLYSPGDIGFTNGGCQYIVLEYVGKSQYLIEFQDEFKYKMLARGSRLKEGKIQNPYFRGFNGQGYVGVGNHVTSGGNREAYMRWQSIWRRIGQVNSPYFTAYVDCTMSVEWHDLQNFGDFYWGDPYRHYDWALDKDIIVPMNREYGPYTCAYVPVELNAFMSFNRTKVNDLPTGVNPNKSKWAASVKVDGKEFRIGSFSSIEEASEMYKMYKKKEATRLAQKWEGLVDPRVTEALFNFEVDKYSRKAV